MKRRLMGTIVSYDVSDKNNEFKDEMISRGYRDGWLEGPKDNQRRIYLPYSSLWHKDKTPKQGLQDLNDAATKLKIKLLRAVALIDDPSETISGDS